MMNVEFREIADEAWASLPSITIGQRSPVSGPPAVHVLIRHGDAPLARVDVHAAVDDPFREAVVWGSFVVIAFGDRLHFVSIPTCTVTTYPVKTYVGHFHAVAGRLVVTDAERIYCFDHTGTLLWKSVTLGAHGVLLNRIEGDRVEGQGEWNAPYGWQTFKIHLWSGMLFDRGAFGGRLTG